MRAKEFITEGGNIFKNPDGTPGTDRISLADIKPTVQWLEKVTGLPLLNNMLGSTGQKESSGDLDLAVDSQQTTKEALYDILIKWAASQKLDPKDFVRKSGDSVHLKTPISGKAAKGFVQTDFMMGDPPWQHFAMAGGGLNSSFKGVHRHLLMASIAKALGFKWSYKHGLVSRMSDKVISREPDYIAEVLLGPGAVAKDLASVESIYEFIKDRPDYDEITQYFKADCEREGLAMPGTINNR